MTKRRNAEGQPAKRGQPTKYKPEYAEMAETLCATIGATDKELAEHFQVTEQTINNWKTQFPVFFESLTRGKAVADGAVKQSLYLRATGYSVPEVHVSNYQGQITKTPIIKHYPPDTTAQIFWLKNRRPDEWRDKHEVVNHVTHSIRDLTDEQLLAIASRAGAAEAEGGTDEPRGVH